MQIITLEQTSITKLTKCFNEAFSGYFVKFNATEEYLIDRWKAAGVDLSLSAGVMDGDLLVGFIINAVREWRGFKSAFNVGTGVIPSHRGNQLTKKMYDFFLPILKEQHVKCIGLEVIQENQVAIHIYEKAGLKIDRGLNCFNGEIRPDLLKSMDGLSFKEMEKPDWEVFKSFCDFEPAWENNKLCIQAAIDQYKFYGVFQSDRLIAYAVIKPENNSISQFAVHSDFRKKKIGTYLFANLSKEFPFVKINNIDADAEYVFEFLKYVGLKNVINQYEMVSYL